MNKITPTKTIAGAVNAKTETEHSAQESDTQAIEATTQEAPVLEYQVYHSSLESTQMITDYGARIRFINFKFITKDKNIMAYLDKEIESGHCYYISKGEKVATDSRDPMEALRAKHFEEFKEMQRREALARADGYRADYGHTGFASGLNALTSSHMPE